jgi:hypothetical protein
MNIHSVEKFIEKEINIHQEKKYKIIKKKMKIEIEINKETRNKKKKKEIEKNTCALPPRARAPLQRHFAKLLLKRRM